MIQELLGGGGGLEKYMGEERKLVVNESGGGGGGGAGGGGSSSDHQALRCPRCDSSNTKFCYYNNYNLTQPRHFCKTCRRYWTKGGALRNVPIGGGCRKNKNSVTNSAATATNRSGKVKTEPSSKPNSGIGLDQETASSSSSSMGSPFLWPGATSQLLDFHSPGTSQHAFSLAMLRAATNQNPNPNSNPNPSRNPNAAVIKEEGLMIGSQQLMSEPAAGVLNSQALTLDSMSPVPMSVGGAGSLWRSSNQQQGLFVGDVQSGAGMQELYQRLRASANFCNSDHTHSQSHHHQQVLNTGSSVLDTTPLANSTELGYWNSPLSWSDLHTTHGAFP